MTQYFIKVNNGYYIGYDRSGKPTVINDFSKARIFDEKQKAFNVMVNLPRNVQRNRHFTIGCTDTEDKKIQDDEPMVISCEATIEAVSKTELDLKSRIGVFDLPGYIQDACNEKMNLCNDLSNVDKEISDILHYIEFNKFNAADGYKLARSLKELRLKRRDIKDQIDFIHFINETGIIDKLNKRLGKLENRVYAPRVNDELFNK